MTALQPAALALSAELERELGLPLSRDLRMGDVADVDGDLLWLYSRSRPGVVYAMQQTPEGIAVHVGEGCESEPFNGPTACWHSKEYSVTTNSQALVKQEAILTPSPVEFSAEQLALIKSQIAKGASDGELALFVATCRRTGLDPFLRQIYAIQRRSQEDGKWVNRMTIQVGIDGMRLIAQRTDKYGGQDPIEYLDADGAWSIVWTGPTKDHPYPLAAKATVYRKDFNRPTVAICRWQSYVQTTAQGDPTSMWKRMPDVMLGKCAESLGLRRAFPAEMSGFAASVDADFDAEAFEAENEDAAEPLAGYIDMVAEVPPAPSSEPIGAATPESTEDPGGIGEWWAETRRLKLDRKAVLAKSQEIYGREPADLEPAERQVLLEALQPAQPALA